jgi:hypothetical protein
MNVGRRWRIVCRVEVVKTRQWGVLNIVPLTASKVQGSSLSTSEPPDIAPAAAVGADAGLLDAIFVGLVAFVSDPSGLPMRGGGSINGLGSCSSSGTFSCVAPGCAGVGVGAGFGEHEAAATVMSAATSPATHRPRVRARETSAKLPTTAPDWRTSIGKPPLE